MHKIIKIKAIIEDPYTGNEETISTQATEVNSLVDNKNLDFPDFFNQVESVVINTTNEIRKETVKHIFETTSLEKVHIVLNEHEPNSSGSTVTIQPVPYEIEAEIGSVRTISHKLVVDNNPIFDTAKEYFIPTGPREKWHSPRLKELEFKACTQMSMRAATDYLNRIRNQDDPSIRTTTLRNRLEREGEDISAAINNIAEQELSSVDYNNLQALPPKNEDTDGISRSLNPEKVEQAAKEIGISEFDPNTLENPECTINLSVDEVCVKGQKAHRPLQEGEKKIIQISKTITHIQSLVGFYIVFGCSILSNLRLVAAFLVKNSLLNNNQLVFYTDGARQIHTCIEQIFSGTDYKIILDWYHLKKKFKDLGSMAFKGKELRNEFINSISPALWRGDVDAALALIENVDRSKVKNFTYLEKLSTYLIRNRDYIPCYALRKKLGLRNSSNRGEKANDSVIAKRQKHKGMSWSNEGCSSLAAITCLQVNGELNDWVYNKTIPFKLVAADNALLKEAA
jgi:hypothetical protein